MSKDLTFDKSLEKIEILFRICGINFTNRGKPNTLRNRVIYIVNLLLLNTDVLGGMVWFVKGIMEGENVTELTHVAPCITLSCLGNLKSLSLLYYEKNTKQLIENTRKLEVREIKRERSNEIDKIIRKEVNLLNTVVNISYVLNVLLLLTFAVGPLVLMILKYVNTSEIEYLFPFRILYPFDVHNIKVWPIVYLRQIWSEVVLILNICAADFLLYTFCTHINIQFQLLRHRIRKIIASERSINRRIDYDENFLSNLIGVINWHKELIWSTNQLERVYTKSTLLNFVSSSFIICLTGFNVTAINNVPVAITFLNFLFMGLMQIYFLCFFGDMLMRASIDVSDAVYNSNWYSADSRIGKHLLLIQIRAQKPCKLTASGFADVNLKAFMKILSTSWSYFALLETMYSSPRQ